MEGLWGEAPPPTAHRMVQLYVSQLRKAFTMCDALGALRERLASLPVLVVAVRGVRADATLTLAPLDADGVAAIAGS